MPDPSIGKIVWRELSASDLLRAQNFYGALFGWTFADFPGSNGGYLVITNRGAGIGGVWPIPAGAEIAPHWGSYVHVPDVDAAAARAAEKGGSVMKPPEDIADVGRFAVCLDPQGGAFYLFKPKPHGDGGPPPTPAPGSFCWETLATSEPDAAIAFYRAVAGWDVAPSPAGRESQVFTAGGQPIADIQRAAPRMRSAWMTYVLVEKLGATRDEAARLGAEVVQRELEVPNVGKVAVIADPEGAILGLFEPGRR
jgi:predicted enzyme related to lactoylglutathione lyase